MVDKTNTSEEHFQGGEPRAWTPQLVQRLNIVNNTISRVVKFWVDNILEGYITEIVVDTIKPYSECNTPESPYLVVTKI